MLDAEDTLTLTSLYSKSDILGRPHFQAEGTDTVADALRPELLGIDARGCRYFSFAGDWEDCRVYKEVREARV